MAQLIEQLVNRQLSVPCTCLRAVKLSQITTTDVLLVLLQMRTMTAAMPRTSLVSSLTMTTAMKIWQTQRQARVPLT